MVSLEVALPAAEVCLERAAVVQVHWSCDVSWYFFNKGVWATGFSRNVWNMGGCFLHCVIAVWKMPTHYWKAMSQAACLVAAVLHQGTLGELQAAALEVFRGCLNVDISCIPNYCTRIHTEWCLKMGKWLQGAARTRNQSWDCDSKGLM